MRSPWWRRLPSLLRLAMVAAAALSSHVPSGSHRRLQPCSRLAFVAALLPAPSMVAQGKFSTRVQSRNRNALRRDPCISCNP